MRMCTGRMSSCVEMIYSLRISLVGERYSLENVNVNSYTNRYTQSRDFNFKKISSTAV